MNSKTASEKIMRQLNSIRPKKVQRLRMRIIAGKYQVNNVELARSLFLTH